VGYDRRVGQVGLLGMALVGIGLLSLYVPSVKALLGGYGIAGCVVGLILVIGAAAYSVTRYR
jgi:hypothetical protein